MKNTVLHDWFINSSSIILKGWALGCILFHVSCTSSTTVLTPSLASTTTVVQSQRIDNLIEENSVQTPDKEQILLHATALELDLLALSKPLSADSRELAAESYRVHAQTIEQFVTDEESATWYFENALTDQAVEAYNRLNRSDLNQFEKNYLKLRDSLQQVQTDLNKKSHQLSNISASLAKQSANLL